MRAEHNPIVGLAWACDELYAVEVFPYSKAWTPDNANLVVFVPAQGQAQGAGDEVRQLPQRPDRRAGRLLYTSNSSISFAPGDGSLLRIVVP